MADLDLSAAFYSALSSDPSITTPLGAYLSGKSIFTRRPVPESALYPMIVVSPDITVTNEDALVSRRPMVVRDVIAYGEQDSDYRIVENLGYLIRDKFHRQKDSLTVTNYQIIDIVASGPFVAPTDDDQHLARGVSLTIRLQRTA